LKAPTWERRCEINQEAGPRDDGGRKESEISTSASNDDQPASVSNTVCKPERSLAKNRQIKTSSQLPEEG